MRSSSIIIEELKDLENVINEGNKYAQESDLDFAFTLSLEQDEFRHVELLEELREAYQHENKHSFDFKIKNIEKYKSISIEKISSSLSAFQSLINTISKSMYKQKVLEMGLVTTYPGSFGMLLVTESNDGELISKTYNTLDYLFTSLNNLNNEAETYKRISEIVDKDDLLKAFMKFYHTQVIDNFDLEFSWGDTYHDVHSTIIKRKRADYLYNSLAKYTKKPDEIVHLAGIVKGISLISNKIEFLSSKDSKPIKISANIDQIKSIEKYFNKNIRIKVQMSTKEFDLQKKAYKTWKFLSFVSETKFKQGQ